MMSGMTRTKADAPVYEVDFTAAAASADPYTHWERARSLGRVVWSPLINGWVVTGFDDVRAVLRDGTHFLTDANFSVGWGGRVLSTTDGQYHRLLKDVFRPAFERDNLIDQWEPAVANVVNASVARSAALLNGGGVLEVMGAFRDIPTATILALLKIDSDIDPDIVQKFQYWANGMIDSINAIYIQDPDQRRMALEEGDQARAEVHGLASQLLRERQQPGVAEDDIIRALALCGLDGEVNENHPLRGTGETPMSDEDMRAQVAQLVGAAQSNTHHNIGHCVMYLAQDEALRQEIAEDRALVPTFIEEVMRHNAAFAVTPRIVADGGYEFAGVQLEAGDRVYAVNAAANRDPSRWDRPEVFDIHRPIKAHVGFGFGSHTCLGVNLARMETRLLVNAVLDQFGPFELLDEDVPYNGRLMGRGPSAVRIRRAR